MINFKELLVGETYNLTTTEILKTLGRDLNSFLLTDIRMLQGASQIEDVVSIFSQYASGNNINLQDGLFYVFKDINGDQHAILKDFISTIEVTRLFPIRVDVHQMDRLKLEQLHRVLKGSGFKYTISV